MVDPFLISAGLLFSSQRTKFCSHMHASDGRNKTKTEKRLRERWSSVGQTWDLSQGKAPRPDILLML